MKITSGMKSVAVGFALLTLCAGSVAAQKRYEAYVVRSGDTLSRIAGRVFGDESRWRELLAENPQVTNANRIFPGDILMVPAPETDAAAAELEARPGDAAMAAAAAEAAPEGAAAEQEAAVSEEDGGQAAAPITIPDLPREWVRPTPVVGRATYRTAGHLAERLPSIAIVATPEDRLLIGTAETAVVNAALAEGERFTVVRASRRVFHPQTGEYLGWLLRILGTAEVTCPGERASTVTMGSMNDAAVIGDYLIPLDPNDVLEKDEIEVGATPACLPAGTSGGVIVAFDEERVAAGDYDLAYIDRGTAAGVNPGQRFTIYREIKPEGRVAIGELQVLRAGARTSTALITVAVKEVQVGNLLRAR